MKTSPGAAASEIKEKSFQRVRLSKAVRRIGMFDQASSEGLTNELESRAVTAKGCYRLGKLLFSHEVINGPWLNITMEDSEQFIRGRLKKYSDPKWQARMFFPDELIQYLAWQAKI